MKSVLAIRHVPFEDLGTFAPLLQSAGYHIRYLDAGIDEIPSTSADDAELLVILGGPIGAYEEDRYPFLIDEFALIERRLAADRPIMGICLGAQLIARTLGSRVYPSGHKEIGWSPIDLSEAGIRSPLRSLAGREVLHWHGDTFDLPDGCDWLASTTLCRNQAFSRGNKLLALQFHAEADGSRIEQWLIGHACELAAAGIDPVGLRHRTERAAPLLRDSSDALFRDWLSGFE